MTYFFPPNMLGARKEAKQLKLIILEFGGLFFHL